MTNSDRLHYLVQETPVDLAERILVMERAVIQMMRERDTWADKHSHLSDEMEALRDLTVCGCGDQFNAEYRGICPNCAMAGALLDHRSPAVDGTPNLTQN